MNFVRFFAQWIPALEWMPKYNSFAFLQHDIIAGLTIAAIIIPQSLAYSALAFLPPVNGLYVSMIPPVVYLFLGTSPYNSIGIMAIIAILVGEALSTANGLVSSHDIHPLSFVSFDVLIAIFLCFVIGIGQLLIAILRGGTFLRQHIFGQPFVSAFTTGSAITILTAQLQPISGIVIPKFNGLYSTPKTWIYFISHLNGINGTTLGVGLVSMLLIITIPKIERSLRLFVMKKSDSFDSNTKLVTVFPEVLLTVVVVSICTTQLELSKNHGVEVIGHIPSGLPPFSLPWELINQVDNGILSKVMTRLIPNIVSICLVSTILLTSIVTAFPSPTLISIHPTTKNICTPPVNQEIFAFAISSIIASFFSCFPPGAPLARSAVLVNKTNVRSPFGIFFTAVAVALSVSFIAPWIQNIPKAVLAAVIFVALIPVTYRIVYIKVLINMAWNECQTFQPGGDPLSVVTELEKTSLEDPPAFTESRERENSISSVSSGIYINQRKVSTEEPVVKTSAIRLACKRALFLSQQWFDPLIWISTFLAVIFLDVGTGIYVGFGVVILFKVCEWMTRHL